MQFSSYFCFPTSSSPDSNHFFLGGGEKLTRNKCTRNSTIRLRVRKRRKDAECVLLRVLHQQSVQKP